MEEEISKRARRTNRFISLTLHRTMQTDSMDRQGCNIGIGAEEFLQGGDCARHMEAMGRYHTGLPNGYGDVWLNRSQEELDEYITKKASCDAILDRLLKTNRDN